MKTIVLIIVLALFAATIWSISNYAYQVYLEMKEAKTIRLHKRLLKAARNVPKKESLI